MAIVDIRIDDRLIHGQVVGYWLPYNKVTNVLIVDDKIVKDDLRKAALKLGMPNGVKLSFYDPQTCAEKLNRNLDKNKNVMILCNRPEPLVDLYESFFKFDQITVGNISPEKGAKHHLKKTLYLTEEDLLNFKKLIEKGVQVNVQMVPNEKKENIVDLL